MLWTVALRANGEFLNIHCGRTQHGKSRFYVEAPDFARAQAVGIAEAEKRRPKCECGLAMVDGKCPLCDGSTTRSEPSERVVDDRELALSVLLEVQAEWLRGPKAIAFSRFLGEKIDELKKPRRPRTATPGVAAAIAVGLGGFVGTTLVAGVGGNGREGL